jgi:hypothetical protein
VDVRSLAPQLLGGLVVLSLLMAGCLYLVRDRENLTTLGRLYGAFLTFQLLLDVLVLVFGAMLWVWPRGAAVALAAFRESIRQPMFWFLVILVVVVFLLPMLVLPFFTFGEDIKMVKELGYDTILLFAGLFTVLAASISISEEIEGRTAITLMSKPVSRRQFLLGKFFGILMAGLLMTGLLSLVFLFVLWFRPYFEREPFAPPPPWLDQAARILPALGDPFAGFLGGGIWWFADALTISSGLLLGFCQVMVLLSITVALATRLPMVVNLPITLLIFFMGNLTPVLAQVTQNSYALVRFMAQLFGTLLPALDFFNIGPALTRDTAPPTGPFVVYLLSVAGYALLYTAIALLFGLILYEDRDLA